MKYSLKNLSTADRAALPRQGRYAVRVEEVRINEKVPDWTYLALRLSAKVGSRAGSTIAWTRLTFNHTQPLDVWNVSCALAALGFAQEGELLPEDLIGREVSVYLVHHPFLSVHDTPSWMMSVVPGSWERVP